MPVWIGVGGSPYSSSAPPGTCSAGRFDLKFGMPGMSQELLMASIGLHGTNVVPRVRELLATPAAA